MKNIALLFLFLGLQAFSFSQTDPINQLDEKGEKHGKWIVYLDKN